MISPGMKYVLPYLLFLCIFFHSAAPSVYWYDEGELITGLANMGLPHSPSFPLFIMTVKPVTWLPLGSIAFRANLVSAIFSALTLTLLLKILSIREPDTTAFSTSDINFYLQGGHVYLPLITFTGDAFSLEGSGLMDFDTSIQLTFRALLGRREWLIEHSLKKPYMETLVERKKVEKVVEEERTLGSGGSGPAGVVNWH